MNNKEELGNRLLATATARMPVSNEVRGLRLEVGGISFCIKP